MHIISNLMSSKSNIEFKNRSEHIRLSLTRIKLWIRTKIEKTLAQRKIIKNIFLKS